MACWDRSCPPRLEQCHAADGKGIRTFEYTLFRQRRTMGSPALNMCSLHTSSFSVPAGVQPLWYLSTNIYCAHVQQKNKVQQPMTIFEFTHLGKPILDAENRIPFWCLSCWTISRKSNSRLWGLVAILSADIDPALHCDEMGPTTQCGQMSCMGSMGSGSHSLTPET
jgi:hypothetical protein